MKCLCATALVVASGSASLGQPDVRPEQLVEGFLDPATLPPGVHAASPYGERTLAAAYDNWTGAGSVAYRGLLARSLLADDVRLSPESHGSAYVTRIGFAVGQPANCPAQQMQVRLQIYDQNIGGPECIPAPNPIWSRVFPIALPANPGSGGVFYRLEADDLGIRLEVADLEITVVQDHRDASGNRFPEPLAATAPMMVIAAAKRAGYSNPSYYRDLNGNGCIEPSEGTSAPGADAGLVVKVEYVAGLCDFDLNGDGSVDQGDLDTVVAAVAGDLTMLRTDAPVELDKNVDGNVDQEDIQEVWDVISGGPSPGCPR